MSSAVMPEAQISEEVISELKSAELQAGPNQYTESNLADLRQGVMLRFPIFDHSNVLLLAAGTVITVGIIGKLRNRGIESVRLHKSEVPRITQPHEPEDTVNSPSDDSPTDDSASDNSSSDNSATSPVAEQHEARRQETPHRSGAAAGRMSPLDLEATIGAIVPTAGPPRHRTVDASRPLSAFQKTIEHHGTSRYDQEFRGQVIAEYEESVAQVDALYKSLEVIRTKDLTVLEDISAEALNKMTTDMDLFVSLGVKPERDKYPARHGQQMSMLAMSIAAMMGYDKQSLIDLGIGCLAHDLGMLHINPQAYSDPHVASQMDFLEITKHPGITFDLMREVEMIAGASRLVAFQIHERCNGMGYPRNRNASQIHPLAKVAAVADVFTALVSPRPHRPGLMPYFAVEHLLKGAKAGLYDTSVVRALLFTTSMFPIGSYVELSDGRVGRTIRSNVEAYATPIVEVWNPAELDEPPVVIDLSTQNQLRILRAIPQLPKSQMPGSIAADEDFWE